MELKGNIKLIKQEQQITDKFKKRELVITTDANSDYPQHVLVEFTQDKCDLLNNVTVGQEVTVSINVRGREWSAPDGSVKYFNTLQGWKLTASESQPVPTNEVDDDLPFS